MIPAYINHVFILILFAVLASGVYPSLSLKLISIGLMTYYFVLLYTNDLKESVLFLGALILMFVYVVASLFYRI